MVFKSLSFLRIFILVEAHFAIVENHILSDIHNYHMVGQQMAQSEEEDEMNEDTWEEEHSDQ